MDRRVVLLTISILGGVASVAITMLHDVPFYLFLIVGAVIGALTQPAYSLAAAHGYDNAKESGYVRMGRWFARFLRFGLGHWPVGYINIDAVLWAGRIVPLPHSASCHPVCLSGDSVFVRKIQSAKHRKRTSTLLRRQPYLVWSRQKSSAKKTAMLLCQTSGSPLRKKIPTLRLTVAKSPKGSCPRMRLWNPESCLKSSG